MRSLRALSVQRLGILDPIILQQNLIFYSYLKLSTGLLVAALQLCQLTVNNAISNAIAPAKAKIHQLNPVL